MRSSAACLTLLFILSLSVVSMIHSIRNSTNDNSEVLSPVGRPDDGAWGYSSSLGLLHQQYGIGNST